MSLDAQSSPAEVVCERSGRVIGVPEGQSILAALGEAGIDVPWMCGAGFCGTCAVPVLAGQAEPQFIAAGSGRMVHVCTAKIQSARLVLDV